MKYIKMIALIRIIQLEPLATQRYPSVLLMVSAD